MRLAPAQFEDLTQPLIGLPVSLSWKGYGSAIFFELGVLSPATSQRARRDSGQACIAVQWDWRVEAQGAVLYGSSNSGPEIQASIQSLQRETIESISVVGDVPELIVRFSNGHCLRSMVMGTGDPEWVIKTFDGRWIYVEAGSLHVGDGGSSASGQEEAVFAMAESAAIRWGIPKLEPVVGQCNACVAFVPLDGNGHLLDYGCCSSEASPFDGKAVQRMSGCPAFASDAAS